MNPPSTPRSVRSTLRAFWDARSVASIATFSLVVISAALGCLPLFDGPGYEAAFAAGLYVPAVTIWATALELSQKRLTPLAPIDALSHGVSNGCKFVGLAWLITMLHGLRHGYCDAWGGSVHFLLGPGFGALLAGVWGAIAGEYAGRVKRRRLAAFLVGLAGPLVCVLVSLGRFYTSPMVYAYDPFVGFFSGSFYDTIIDFSGLYTYRVGTTATLLAAVIVALHLERKNDGKLAFRNLRRPGLLLLGAAAFFVSIGLNVQGYRFNHWHTAKTIQKQLANHVTHGRCDVFAARGIPKADVERFARECHTHILEQEVFFDIHGPERIAAYLFSDSAQKGALMGAADTYIAKPWRHEVYLQQNGFPHPVLGHEIAHVMAGAFGRGPFEIAGKLGGFWPSPGLIEGIAVAASPHEGALSPRDWARAMKDLNLLPGLQRLFAFGFYGENSTVAYTASGAFVIFIQEKYGANVLRAWYGGASLPEITKTSWRDLEQAFHQDLMLVELPDAAMAQARARFQRPGLFSRRCPHVVDGCRKRAEEQRARGDDEGAMETFSQWLDLDPGDASARVAEAKTLLRLGQTQKARTTLEEIVKLEAFPRSVRDGALEELGDLALEAGDTDRAMEHYREVMSRSLDENVLRTLDVKIEAAKNPRARRPIVELLIGHGGRGPDKVRAAEALGGWAAEKPADGLPEYLLARSFISTGQFDEAAERLERAINTGLPIPRVAAEALRLRLVVACALGNTSGVEKWVGEYLARSDVFMARRQAMAKFASRCTGKTIRVQGPNSGGGTK
jgi:tetratricopeptide (TPR) repeat protein